MKERPIPFTADMVRVILNGHKTQTRRVIKSQPPENSYPTGEIINGHDVMRKDNGCTYSLWFAPNVDKCPHGVIGDRLWVRETWAHIEPDVKPMYKADYTYTELAQQALGFRWKSSRFMPRKYSRITLEITKIRVERVQDIKDEEAIYEGCPTIIATVKHPKACWEWFHHLWDSLNAKPKPVLKNSKLARMLLNSETLNLITGNIACYVSYPWDDVHETRQHRGKQWFVMGNPFVWVIEFKKLEER